MDEIELQLLNQRDGVPPVDDTPSDTSTGELPATAEDIDDEDD